MVVEKVFAVIAESTRRDLLEALAQESKSVGQLVDELGVSQPTVSKHLRVLREAGVVTMRAQGQKRFYGINTEPLVLVSAWLDSLGAGIGEGSGNGVAPAAAASAAASLAAAPGSPAGAAPANGSGVAPAKPRLVVPVAAAAAPVAAATSAPAVAVANAGPTGTPGSAQPAAARLSAPSPAAATAAATPSAAKAPAAAAPSPAVSVPAAPSKPGAVVPVPGTAAALMVPDVVHVNENDGGVPGQFSRSVGRAANKAADLLANLPALPTFKRRKN